MQNQQSVYIIGAGVSGLIAAYELEQNGYKPVIIEQSNAVGGRVKTIEKNGYKLDLGFQVLLDAYPLAKQYLNMEALNLQKLASGALIYSNSKSSQIGDPTRDIKMLFPTLFSRVGSISDKIKILKLNNRLKKKSIEAIFSSPESSTLDHLIEFGFSDQIISQFFRPFFSGIFLEPTLRTSSRMFEFVYKMFGDGYATIPKSGIGAISEQLRHKLKRTEFMFNTKVKSVSNQLIVLDSGQEIEHQGTIITSNASTLLSNLKDQETKWKSCMCLYFKVDQTNIPEHTIGLVANKDYLSNNLYAYTDQDSGEKILSVTSLNYKDKTDEEMIEAITGEIRELTNANSTTFIHSFRIDEALPDIDNLRESTQPSESQVLDNVFLAGDSLFNGSLNAAMESGRLAALGLMEKQPYAKS